MSLISKGFAMAAKRPDVHDVKTLSIQCVLNPAQGWKYSYSSGVTGDAAVELAAAFEIAILKAKSLALESGAQGIRPFSHDYVGPENGKYRCSVLFEVYDK